jgi:two-component system phosphate regulon response regulator PhoB
MVKDILVVEDEAPIREMLAFTIGQAGFQVREAADAPEAHRRIAEQVPDLILLDWMLPGVSGVEFARHLKKNDLTRRIPIIMLTARGEESDRLRGFEVGADDYVTKPFSTRELSARIKAVLRRSTPDGEEERIEVNGLVLDTAGHRVSAQGREIHLGPTEFRLLHFLMSHAERAFSRDQLLDRVWGMNVYVEDRTVDVYIRRLRKVLAPFGYDALIQTVRGLGYRLSVQV